MLPFFIYFYDARELCNLLIFVSGGAVLKTLKLSLVNSSFVVQSTLNFPVRNAARKGYRDKVMKAKQQKKLEAPVPVGKEEFKLRLIILFYYRHYTLVFKTAYVKAVYVEEQMLNSF